jgi:hypothetical protein
MGRIYEHVGLMTVRIDWTDVSRRRVIATRNQEMLEDEPQPDDLSANTCDIYYDIMLNLYAILQKDL